MDKFYPLQAHYYLEMEFKKRIGRRPRYSMRAFARDLEIGVSTLSEVLSGKASLSKDRIQILGAKIGLTPEQINHWVDLVIISHSKNQSKVKEARQRLNKKKLDLELFKLISDWYYLAILELLEIAPQLKPIQMAKRLGIGLNEVTQAIDRMLKLGFLYEEGGEYCIALGDISIGNEMASEAIKKFHNQMLKKAQEALVTQDLRERDFQSWIFSIRKQDLSGFKKEIQEALLPIIYKYEGKSDKDSVYNLSYQLFDIAHLKE